MIEIDEMILYRRLQDARIRFSASVDMQQTSCAIGRLTEIESLIEELGLTDELDDHDFDTELDGKL